MKLFTAAHDIWPRLISIAHSIASKVYKEKKTYIDKLFL